MPASRVHVLPMFPDGRCDRGQCSPKASRPTRSSASRSRTWRAGPGVDPSGRTPLRVAPSAGGTDCGRTPGRRWRDRRARGPTAALRSELPPCRGAADRTDSAVGSCCRGRRARRRRRIPCRRRRSRRPRSLRGGSGAGVLLAEAGDFEHQLLGRLRDHGADVVWFDQQGVAASRTVRAGYELGGYVTDVLGGPRIRVPKGAAG
jgi:hypothetical protein